MNPLARLIDLLDQGIPLEDALDILRQELNA